MGLTGAIHDMLRELTAVTEGMFLWEETMAKTELQDRNSARIDPGKIDEFAATLAGRLIRPADPDYDAARRIWNAAIDKHPGLIARCLGVADVVQAVKFAAANNLLVAVRGGGHNVAGRALCDKGLVIDLSAMRGVLVDPDTRTVRVQGGATLGDLDRETHLHGLAVPMGIDFQDRRRRADAWRRRRLAGAQTWAELRQRHLVRVGDGRRQGADGQRRQTP